MRPKTKEEEEQEEEEEEHEEEEAQEEEGDAGGGGERERKEEIRKQNSSFLSVSMSLCLNLSLSLSLSLPPSPLFFALLCSSQCSSYVKKLVGRAVAGVFVCSHTRSQTQQRKNDEESQVSEVTDASTYVSTARAAAAAPIAGCPRAGAQTARHRTPEAAGSTEANSKLEKRGREQKKRKRIQNETVFLY